MASRPTISKAFLFAAAFAAAVSTAVADETPTPPPPAGSALKVHALTRDIEVHQDGSTTTVTHTELQLLTAALLAQESQQALQYDASLQQLDIVEAYTLKADGRKLPVAPDAILARQAPQSASSLLFTNVQQKVIVFPNVEVGDTLVYTTRTQSRPPIPGQFTYDTVIPPTLTIDLTRVTVTAPAALVVEAKGLEVKKSAGAGGGVSYTVSFSNARPVSDSGEALSRFDRGPRFSASSFKSYDALAASYAALVLPRLAVTPKIQAEADTLTAGIREPREQAHRLYDWVSTHIRYVAIEFGAGGIVPHDADSVLANAYGDCKDHAALFSALLRAKGIASNLVLINSQNGYAVSAAPSLSAFDHVITWLPQFGLYADTTAGIAAFGVLPQSEYGKPVLHIADGGAALRQTPVLAAGDAVVRHVTTATLDDQARLAVVTTTTASGALATALRGFGRVIQAAGTAKFADDMLKEFHMPLATGDFTVPPQAVLDDAYAIEARYNTQHRPKLLSGEDFVLPATLSLISPTGAIFLGPVADDKFKDSSASPCYSGEQIDDYALDFPATRRIDKLPADSTVRTAHIAYAAHWSLSGHTLRVHRELTATFDKAVCAGAMHKEIADALARVREDNAARIALVAAAP